MLTINIWQTVAFNEDWLWTNEEKYPLYAIFFCLLLSVLTIPIDLIFSPMELIAYIIYKIANKEVKDEQIK